MLPKSQFARSVSVLAGGTVLGQAIVVLASPVLTHLYSPSDFGLVAIFASLLGVLSAVAALRYELAIPLPKRDHEAMHLIVVCLLSTLAFALAAIVAVVFYRAPIANALNSPALAAFLWLLPVAVLMSGTYKTLSYWAIRKRAFKTLARTKLVQTTSMTAIQIGGWALGPWALISGLIVGHTAGIGMLARTLPKLGLRKQHAKPSALDSGDASKARETNPSEDNDDVVSVCLGTLCDQVVKYKALPLISTWAAFASAIAANSIAPLLAIFYGTASVGLYAIAARVIAMPMSVIGKAVSDVFYKEAAVAHEEGRLGMLVVSVADQLLRLAVPVAILGFLVAPRLIPIVFGENWAVSGDIVQAATVWALSQFVVSSSTPIYPIINKLHVAMFFEVTLAGYAVVAIVLGSYVFGTLVAAIWLLAIGNSVIYVARMATTLKLTNAPLGPLIRSALISAALGIVACSPLLIHQFLTNDDEGKLSAIEAASMALSGILVLGLFLGRWRRALRQTRSPSAPVA